MPRGFALTLVLALSSAAAVTTTFSGCDSACTVIGGESGVSVHVDPALLASLGADPVDARVCLGGQCHSAPLSEAARTSPAQDLVRLVPVELDEEARDIQVALTRGDRAIVGPFTTTIHPQTLTPNGKGCPPTVHQADVSLTPEEAREMEFSPPM